MADKKISALTGASTPLAGTEVLPIVQSGATVKVAVSDLTAGRAVSATAVTASTGNFVVSTTNKGITTGSSIPLGFGTNNATTSMTLDTAGKVGVAVTPSAWASGGSPAHALQVGIYSALSSSGAYGGSYSNNAYYTAAGWKYISSDNASRYGQISGEHQWYTAASGTADGVVSFTQAMNLSSAGNLSFGTAAKGINFTANTPAAGKTSQLLNWYEEGTWTPVPANLTVVGTPTYTGKYTRIGRMVSCIATIDSTTSTAATAGSTSFGGLPFASVAISGTNAGNGTTVDSNLTTQVGSGYIFSANNKFYVTGWTATQNIVMSFVFYTS